VSIKSEEATFIASTDIVLASHPQRAAKTSRSIIRFGAVVVNEDATRWLELALTITHTPSKRIVAVLLAV